MKTKKCVKRITALLLAMAMILSLLITGVWANEFDGEDTSEPEISTQAEQEQEPEGSEATDDEGAGEDIDEDLACDSDNEDEGVGPADRDEVDEVDEVEATASAGETEDADEIVGDEELETQSDAPNGVTYENGDWRLPSDASELYLQAARDVIAGKTQPERDMHFTIGGINADYLYNGDGTYTLSTSGKLDVNTPEYGKFRDTTITSRIREGLYSSKWWLDNYKVGTLYELGQALSRDPSKRTAEQEQIISDWRELEAGVLNYYRNVKVTKYICDSTYTLTYTYKTDNSSQKYTRVWTDCAAIVSPLSGALPKDSFSYGSAYMTTDGYGSDYSDLEKSVEEISFGPHVKVIGNYCCCDWTGLKTVHFSDSVTDLLTRCFEACTGLKEFVIPASVKEIATDMVWEKKYPDWKGNYGRILTECNLDRLVFMGDIVIGDMSLSNGASDLYVDTAIAYGDVVFVGTSGWSGRVFDFRKSLWHKKIPGNSKQNYGGGSGFTGKQLNPDDDHTLRTERIDLLHVGGDAYFVSMSIHSSRGIKKFLIDGNAYFNKKCKDESGNWRDSVPSISAVDSLVVGGNLTVGDPWHSTDWDQWLPVFRGLDSVTVKGKVKASEYAWKGTAFENYSVKSHGTTTAEEAKANSVATPKITSAKSEKKRSISVKWTKSKNGVGYQIQASTDQSFRKSVKTVKVSGVKSGSASISKLESKKKYYVRIRTLAKSGKNSMWSDTKSVKVK